MPSLATFSSAARPTKSPGLPSFTTRPSPAWYGFVVAVELVAVERHPGLEAERVAGAEADRDHPVRPPGLEDAVPRPRPRAGTSTNSSNPSSPV